MLALQQQPQCCVGWSFRHLPGEPFSLDWLWCVSRFSAWHPSMLALGFVQHFAGSILMLISFPPAPLGYAAAQ